MMLFSHKRFRRFVTGLLPGVLAGALCVAACGAAEARDLYRWVQFVPGGIEARAVTDGPTCPAAMIDGVAAVMTERSAPGENYPVRGCALPIPAGAKLVTVDRKPMPLPKAHPDRILLIGDTGCRLKGDQVQDCNDIGQWPFRTGADISAGLKPDLVIHVGDMHYRESDCPVARLGCAGTPFGDSWDVWKEDFFKPGDSLLAAAPWIMDRGNHEECERGGKGWARLLDPYPFDATTGVVGCLGPAKPFTVDIGGVTIVVMDVSTASEKVNEKQVAWYKPQFEMAKTIPGPVWLTFHRPIWAVDSQKAGDAAGDNPTLAAAARNSIPSNVQAMISGHHHTFELMTYVDDLPMQIVSGHGGDDLSIHAPTVVKGLEINGVKVKDGVGRPGVFGFSTLERAHDDATGLKWILTGYDIQGKSIARCELNGRDAACK
jgi:hypothetical protein